MRLLRVAFVIASSTAALWTIPHTWCAANARALLADDVDVDARFGRGAIEMIRDRTPDTIANSEWRFASYVFAVLGLGQTTLAHPELASAQCPAMDAAVDRMLQPDLRRFDTASWGKDAFAAAGGTRGHVGYLSYLSVALAMNRLANPGAHDADEQRVVDAMIRRLQADLMPETYPGQRYPVDVSTAIAAIALHDRATGQDHSALLARWTKMLREHWLDGDGLLIQRFDGDERPVDIGRGSGTFLAAYFVAFADPATARQLWNVSRDSLYDPMLGFGMMREVPEQAAGREDIDSGPVILGRGVSSTGFALAPARIFGDPGTFSALLATTDLFGVPVDTGDERRYASGGPLGDAILYAMITAPEVPK